MTLPKTTLYELWNASLAAHADRPFLGFVGEGPWTFADTGDRIRALQTWLAAQGLKSGDRVALYAPNSPAWGAAYLALTAGGLTAVPILADFHPREVYTILEHGEVKALLAGASLQPALQAWRQAQKPAWSGPEWDLAGTVEEASAQAGLGAQSPGPSGPAEPLALPAAWKPPEEEDLAALIYTSGTTGASKGVMLSHRNIVSNVLAAQSIPPMEPGDEFLSVLPMAHTYECTLGFLIPCIGGCRVHYLTKPAAPAVLLPALASVRPHLMLTVPLLIEKVYKAKVQPVLSKPVMGVLTKIPGLGQLLHRVIGKKLMTSFGGRLKFFGIGGAALDPTVEKFLRKAGFPYAIGYGLTETAPLLAGTRAFLQPYRSTGPVLSGVQMRLAEVNPTTGEGEIQVQGPNVMQGYYKNPELTAEVMTADGWFRTGDLGLIKKGMVFIRGRLKNVILGPSGENIYPEALEALINQDPYVLESLVLQLGKELVAKVVLNTEALKENLSHLPGHFTDLKEAAAAYLHKLHESVNHQLARWSRISKVEEQKEPFEKTPTMKIKRFLYKK